MTRTVLVTGVSRHVGARVANQLALHPDVSKVIGLDVVSPAEDLGEAEFVRADVRNPVVGRLLNQAAVDTVVHLALSTSHAQGRARSSQKEDNVIGTMQLFAACQQATGLQRIVLKSTSAVYGSSAHAPAMFTEDQTAPRSRAQGPVRDALEVEGYLRATRRRRPDLEHTTLRLTHVVGPQISSPLLDYLSLPIVPIPFGYDARLQLLHVDDAVAAIVSAVVGPAVGVVNVAAPGVLKLSQAIALAGRPSVWVPTSTGVSLGRLASLGKVASFGRPDVDYLRFGRVLDTTRATELLGFRPGYSTREAFLSAAAAFPPPVPGVAAVRGWAGALTAALFAGDADAAESGPGSGSASRPASGSVLDVTDVVVEEAADATPYDVLSGTEPTAQAPQGHRQRRRPPRHLPPSGTGATAADGSAPPGRPAGAGVGDRTDNPTGAEAIDDAG